MEGLRKSVSRRVGAAASAVLVLALSGCASSSLPPPQSPAQSVYEMKAALADQIAIEAEYAALQRCIPGAPALCSAPPLLRELHDARVKARAALDTAQAVVTGQITGVAPDAAVAQAQAAIATYAATTSTLKVTP